MKKVFSLFLVLLLCLNLFVPVYASDGYVDEIGNVTTGLTENESSTGTASYEIITGNQYHLYSYARAFYVFDGVAPLQWSNSSSNSTWADMIIVGAVNDVAIARHIYKFNESKVIEKITVHLPIHVASGVGPYVTLNAQYSDDGSTWTTVKTIVCDPVSTGEDKYDLIFEDIDTGSHTYWAVLCESYNYEFGGISEIYMYSFDGSAGGSAGGSDDESYENSILGWLSRLFDAIKSIPQKLSDLSNTIGGFFDTLWKNIQNSFSSLISNITDIYNYITENLSNFFTNLGNTIGGFFDNLWNKIVAFFTPDTDKIAAQFDSLYDKFSFIQVITTIVSDISNLFSSNPEPPVIKLDLSLNESSLNLGTGKYSILDFNWFERYKPTTDIFISAFLWISFIWLLYKRLPDIVSGVGMVTEFSSTNFSSSSYRNSIRVSHGLGRDK